MDALSGHTVKSLAKHLYGLDITIKPATNCPSCYSYLQKWFEPKDALKAYCFEYYDKDADIVRLPLKAYLSLDKMLDDIKTYFG